MGEDRWGTLGQRVSIFQSWDCDLTTRTSGADGVIKPRPSEAEVNTMKGFEERWKSYYATSPDKPVMLIFTMAAYAGLNPALPLAHDFWNRPFLYVLYYLGIFLLRTNIGQPNRIPTIMTTLYFALLYVSVDTPRGRSVTKVAFGRMDDIRIKMPMIAPRILKPVPGHRRKKKFLSRDSARWPCRASMVFLTRTKWVAKMCLLSAVYLIRHLSHRILPLPQHCPSIIQYTCRPIARDIFVPFGDNYGTK